LIQRNAIKTWKEKGEFRELLLRDREVAQLLTKEEITECFDVTADLKNVDGIFKRVFSKMKIE
jgi:adenylosuccinate lyase